MSMTIEDVARVAHEVNLAYCQSIGDYSHVEWDKAPQWQRDAAIRGVEIHLKDNLTPDVSHKQWMFGMIADGWTFGQQKDPEAKKHPCLVHYPYLPREQQIKDHIFVAVVRSLRNQVQS